MDDGGPRPLLLLVDDDELIVESLRFALEPEFDIVAAASRPAALTALRAGRVPPLALVDLGLPPAPHQPDEGFRLIRELFAFNPRMKVLVLSGQSAAGNVQHALTLGAVDFVPKPCDANLLLSRLRHQLMLLEAELPAARDAATPEEILAGESSAMVALRGLIAQFADTPFPVLVEGESGSGKELVAECLHRASARRERPMLTLNCAAFSPELLEAQLFGHARGAYTGADKARAGFFEEAAGGTLFLDEVGEMPLDLQARFLRVLENGEFYRLGETERRHSDARIVAATNRDLREGVRAGSFRPDLFHRLSVLTLSVPPLRSRGDDWRLLLDRFQRQYAGTIKPFVLGDSAAALLADYGFPGNVRELRNIVIRLGAKYPGQTIEADALHGELELDYEAPAAAPALAPGDLAARLREPGFRLDRELEALERAFVETALELGDGNLSKAARLLGINRTTLYGRLARLGLAPPSGDA